jgi:hypothetical protein
MSTPHSDTAAISTAARELHLPTVRAETTRLAEIAVRQRHTRLAYLAEVLAAEVDDRSQRRRIRRITDAKFPRLKRLADEVLTDIQRQAVHRPVHPTDPGRGAVRANVPRTRHHAAA